MVTSDFTNFLTALQTALVIDGTLDTDWPNIYPYIIQDAELMVYRDLDPLYIYKLATTTFSTGSALLALPSDCVVVRELSYYTPVSSTSLTGTRVQLERRSMTFLRDYWPTPATVSPPKYFAEVGPEVFVTPTPDAAYTVEMLYLPRPVTFSASNTPTYLSTYYPDLLFYACMVIASGYLKNYGSSVDDPQQGMSWKTLYDKALATAKVEEARRKSEQSSWVSPTLTNANEAV